MISNKYFFKENKTKIIWIFFSIAIFIWYSNLLLHMHASIVILHGHFWSKFQINKNRTSQLDKQADKSFPPENGNIDTYVRSL